ncbi:hypothetical protein LXL04_036809 [Taraxacum kok-saghyz]
MPFWWIRLGIPQLHITWFGWKEDEPEADMANGCGCRIPENAAYFASTTASSAGNTTPAPRVPSLALRSVLLATGMNAVLPSLSEAEGSSPAWYIGYRSARKNYFGRKVKSFDSYEFLTNQHHESLEDTIIRPLITMLEDIRVWAMERLFKCRQKGQNWDLEICPAIRRKLEDLKVYQRFWNVYVSGYQEFEVIQGNEREWQLTGIPCVHGMAAIASLNLNPKNYVAKCFYKTAYLNSYAHAIRPLNDSSLWPTNPDLFKLLPPTKRRLPGRPCVKRKRDAVENQMTGRHTVFRRGIAQRCTLCQETGHNKAKCPKKNIWEVELDVEVEAELDAEEDVEVRLQWRMMLQWRDDAALEEEAIRQEEAAMEENATMEEEATMQEEPALEEETVMVEEEVRQRRRPLERITLAKLGKCVVTKDGKGCTRDKPCELD